MDAVAERFEASAGWDTGSSRKGEKLRNPYVTQKQEEEVGGFQYGGFMLYWLQNFRAAESCFIDDGNREAYNVIFFIGGTGDET